MENSKKILVTWPGYRHAVIDADPEDLLSQLQRYVCGRIEVVRSSRRWPVVLGDDLDRHLVCVVNEEGLLHMMRINEAATWITWYPGILVGPAVFLREGLNEDGEPDLLPLKAEEAQRLAAMLTLASVDEREGPPDDAD